MRLLSVLHRFQGEDDGAVLVEMALVTPFLLLLSAGVFEFSGIIHTRLLLEAGVEDAARYIARCSDTQATCEANARNLAVNGAVSGGAVRVPGWTGDTSSSTPDGITFTYTNTPITVDSATGLTNYRSQTANVTVVEVSSSFLPTTTGLWSFLGFGPLTLTVSHEERVIGW
jgi:Flp pilus assembly protein TadG